jgi:asparagine synthase (glutamine-hydrolysing)
MNRDFELLPRAVWHCENPSATGIEILQLILSRFSSKKFKVILTGEGSDEVLGGYGWFRADKLYRPLARLPLALRRMMLLGSLLPSLRPYASQALMAPGKMGLERYRALTGQAFQPSMKLLSEDLQMTFREAGNPDDGPAHPYGYQKWPPYAQLQFYEMTLRLPGFILNHLDHMTMASSLEVRVPFLDHELVEFCAGIPSDLKLKGMNEKYVLRRALSSILPEEIVKRKKRGLWAPHAYWLRDKLPDFAEEMFSESTLRCKGYFDPAEVRTILQRHREGKVSHTRELMAVLVIQLWDETFVDGPVDKPPS